MMLSRNQFAHLSTRQTGSTEGPKNVSSGINGFGRIGRLVFRAASANPDVVVKAINDPPATWNCLEPARWILTNAEMRGPVP